MNWHSFFYVIVANFVTLPVRDAIMESTLGIIPMRPCFSSNNLSYKWDMISLRVNCNLSDLLFATMVRYILKIARKREGNVVISVLLTLPFYFLRIRTRSGGENKKFSGWLDSP